jgi:hypothetical protein
MKVLLNFFFVILSLLILLNHCTVQKNGEEEENPLPILTSISPNSKVAHMPTFTLTALGTDFVSNSNIVFDGKTKQTIYVSATELTCLLEPDDIIAAVSTISDRMDWSGTLSKTVPVLVHNPSPGGGDSDTLDFTILDNHTFYAPSNISNNSGNSSAPYIVVDVSGNINVVWHDYTSGNYEIYFRRSTDNGVSWSQTANLSNSSGDSFYPTIAVDSSGNINFVCCDSTQSNYEIYFRRSTDDGASWSQPINISNNAETSYKPVIVADSSGKITVVWEDFSLGNFEIYSSFSNDNGANWNQAVNVSNNTKTSRNPMVAVDSSGNINVVWHDYTPGNYEIYFSRSIDNGVTWTPEVNISNNTENSFSPFLAVDSFANLNVVWYDYSTGNNEIYFCRSTDNGVSWSQTINISNNTTYSYWPVIAVDSAVNINVIWSNDVSGKHEIYFCRSTDNGVSWSQVLNISNTVDHSYRPAIALDNPGNIYVVWRDLTPGNSEIYFTSNTH